MLETQLKEVEAKIQAACDRAGRKLTISVSVCLVRIKCRKSQPNTMHFLMISIGT